MNTCKFCFFSEISLRNDAIDFNKWTKLWCWFKEEHVFKTQFCGKWFDKSVEGDPRKVAELSRDLCV